MKQSITVLFILLVLGANLAWSQNPASTGERVKSILASGPDKGRLLLIGGGISRNQMKIFQKFSGGKDSTIIVIPTALSDDEILKDPSFEKIRNRFEGLGAANVKILHTRDRDTANSEEFVKPIENAAGIFILGGKTQRIIDSYLNTRTHEAMKKLLERDGIIGGVSAGSGCLASYFFNNELETGFEFLKGAIIMNHFISKNKQFDHVHEINQNRERIAIGIDDDAGILIQKEKFEVIGPSYVAVYDNTSYDRYTDSISALPPNSERFYFLKNGERYNLNKRQVETNSRLTPADLSSTDLAQYEGTFKAKNKDFEIEFILKDDVLSVKNSWGWDIYPIYPLQDNIFYATNRNMWFKFIRDETEVVGVLKMRSLIQENVIVEMEKQ